MGTRELLEQRKAQRREKRRADPPRRPASNSQTAITGTGPGSQLKRICLWFGFKPTKTCPCGDHVRVMDNRGVAWCRGNLRIIEQWIMVERDSRGITCVSVLWGLLVRGYQATDRFMFSISVRGAVRLAIYLAGRHGHA